MKPEAILGALHLFDRWRLTVAALLGEPLHEIADERGQINRRRLGRWIARHQGRIVHGLKFVRDTQSGGAERWKVVSGVSGITSPHAGQSVTGDTEVFA